MNSQIVFALLLIFIITVINPLCLKPESLPDFNYEGIYVCALVFTGSVEEAKKCSGQKVFVPNAKVAPILDPQVDNKVVRVIVKPQCTLFAYSGANFTWKPKEFKGPVDKTLEIRTEEDEKRSEIDQLLAEAKDDEWGKRISSWSCYCKYTNALEHCHVTQKWRPFHVCKNNREVDFTCIFTYKTGLILGPSLTHGELDLENAVDIFLRRMVGIKYRKDLDASTQTEFKWNVAKSDIFKEPNEEKGTCEIPPNTTMIVYDLIGVCDDNIVYTGLTHCGTPSQPSGAVAANASRMMLQVAIFLAFSHTLTSFGD